MVGAFTDALVTQAKLDAEDLKQQKERIEYLESEIAKLGKFVLNADLGFPKQDEAKYPLGMTPVDSAIEYIKHVHRLSLKFIEDNSLGGDWDWLRSALTDLFKEILKADWHEKVQQVAARQKTIRYDWMAGSPEQHQAVFENRTDYSTPEAEEFVNKFPKQTSHLRGCPTTRLELEEKSPSTRQESSILEMEDIFGDQPFENGVDTYRESVVR